MKCKHELDYEVCILCYVQAKQRAYPQKTLKEFLSEEEDLLLKCSKLLQELKSDLVRRGKRTA